MRVGVGYSDNPDSLAAGAQAARDALTQAELESCDLVLLFSTARHDPQILRQAVAAVVGPRARIVGGWAVGTLTNRCLGYAGDQVGLAAFTLDSVECQLIAEGDLAEGETLVGERIGQRLAALGTGPESPVVLFYDTVDRTSGRMSMLMATPLLTGIERSLGYLPALVGAGLTGDMVGTPTRQWTGEGIAERHALALLFSAGVRMDSIIMHGCQPCTGYYTVTKADAQTILEIDGRPALEVIGSILGDAIAPEDFGFFVTLGVNMGDKWGDFDESAYVNRMCLKIDRKRGGLVMFEPDMVEGTQFQVMHRSVNMDYIAPRIESLFAGLDGRTPVFAFYIDCAGRAAGFAGIDAEDAAVVQRVVGERVPLLGIYSGVEVGSVLGRPRALDWTGVFCLFSI
ncbi:hypothetical protein OTERR_20090 [Oryzomicrobium terrae]|uniref:Uncharacterized protein n=1 Tax=Oryzomicrobium terrae TaxID=1735038 RepID=A0A5C1E9W8_9RHOO|nr:FIST N-terminal domain-containing protein [Oryzomicrobium terrae]QEL65485.1 hypothetical protein OTERR_20090 [Oryzomicrobium terrae]